MRGSRTSLSAQSFSSISGDCIDHKYSCGYLTLFWQTAGGNFWFAHSLWIRMYLHQSAIPVKVSKIILANWLTTFVPYWLPFATYLLHSWSLQLPYLRNCFLPMFLVKNVSFRVTSFSLICTTYIPSSVFFFFVSLRYVSPSCTIQGISAQASFCCSTSLARKLLYKLQF